MARPPPAPAAAELPKRALPGEHDTAQAALDPGPVADVDEALGSKTLAQLRAEAVEQRQEAIQAILPERAILLQELFFLLTDKSDPARLGAGLDPTGFTLDPANATPLREKIATFVERWIREPRVAGQIPLDLPPLKPTPPPSPLRRDSAMLDMSEEVAAVERELIKPEYKKQAPPPLMMGENASGQRNDNAMSNGHKTVNGMDIDEQPKSASPTRPDGHPQAHKRQHSLISPFPITFHSPGFSASTPPLKHEGIPFPLVIQTDGSPSITEAEPTASTSNLNQTPGLQTGNSSATAVHASEGSQRPSPFKPVKTERSFSGLPGIPPFRNFSDPFPQTLPLLPDHIVRNRLNIGGLSKKKARERAAAQQNPQLAASMATSADLYKLGMSKALHLSVRSLVGAGAPAPDKARTGGKALLTSDWQTAIAELQSQRVMERIEQLKAERSWSLRQFRKQRPATTHKAHWDYLLDEMHWMAVDFRQESRWKVASAYEMAKAVKQYHRATTDEERKALQISVRPPNFLVNGKQTNGHVSDNGDSDMHTATQPADSGETEGAGGTTKELEQDGEVKTLQVAKNANNTADEAIAGSTQAVALPLPPVATEPRHKKYRNSLIQARAPLFDLKPDVTVFNLSKAGLPDVYDEVATFDLTNEFFQELVAYGPPAEPSMDSRQTRRIDESNPNFSRISNPSYLLEGKPLLVSTLHPAKKRKLSGGWGDMSDLVGDENRDLLAEMFGSAADMMYSPGMKVKDTGNKRFAPVAPPNAEARAASIDWSPEEDRQLFIYARQYSFNWDLIATVFNGATLRPKSDERLPWDCFDRWHKKYAPLPTPSTGQANAVSASAPGQTAGVQASGQPSPGGVLQTQQAQAQANLPQNKKDKRSTSVTLQAQGVATSKKPELSKAQIRHMSIIEATKKAQKKREAQQKNNMMPPVRKINLNAHESHNQPMHPSLTALDLSRLKAERERQQLEEMRKREQAKLYQQAQAAAMAQQQLQAQQQAQQAQQAQQGNQPQQRGPVPIQPQTMQGGQQMPQMPQGGVPLNQQGMMQQQQQQRMSSTPNPQQVPPGMHMQGGSQQGGPRPGSQQQAMRPPSQSGHHPQQVLMNGQIPIMGLPGSSPPMQANLPPGMHLPIQPMQPQHSGSHSAHSQSPQPGHMPQLSPQQMQMQLQSQQAGLAQLSPAQQQALLAQLSQARAGSPGMPGQMPGGFPMQANQHLTPEQQQQQLMLLMRMRQNSQASSQGSVQ